MGETDSHLKYYLYCEWFEPKRETLRLEIEHYIMFKMLGSVLTA